MVSQPPAGVQNGYTSRLVLFLLTITITKTDPFQCCDFQTITKLQVYCNNYI